MSRNRTIFAFAAGAGIASMVALSGAEAPDSPTRISFMQSPVLSTLPAPSTSSSTGTATVERKPDGHYWAAAQVNGLKIDLLVDTGASQVVLTQADAQRIGINPYALDYNGTASTANGEVRTASLTIDRLQVGGVAVENVPTIVTHGALDTSLLGMSFLGALDSFEFKGNELILRE